MRCRICSAIIPSKNLKIIKNMPPSAQYFSDRKTNKNQPINYTFALCLSCKVPQILNKPVKYFKETIRATGLSKNMTRFRSKQFKEFAKDYNLKKKRIIEIGCNKGENLIILNRYVKNSFGVEYNKYSVDECKKKNLRVRKFFLDKINKKIHDKPFDAFIILNFLEHIPNLNLFFKSLKRNLNTNAVGLIEVPNFDMIKSKGLYTEIIIDHLYYFSEKNLSNLLEKFGFKILKQNKIFDDYIISFIVKKVNNSNINRIVRWKNNFSLNIINKSLNLIKKRIDKFKDKINNEEFIIWGAGHQSLMICSYFKLKSKVRYIVDSAIFKQNRFAPGSNIKILKPSYLSKEKQINNILVIAGGYSKEIATNIKKNFPNFNVYIFDKNIIYKYF